MTAQRQEGNGWRPGIAFITAMASLVGLSLGVMVRPEAAAAAATTERVVLNRFTGLAIEGFDPVAQTGFARLT